MDKKAIVKEALRWVQENKELKPVSQNYHSPRISSEIPDCSMPMTFDDKSFCSLGCLYCFAYYQKSNNPVRTQFQLETVNVDRIINAMQGKPKNPLDTMFYEYFYKRKFLLHWGGLADPFCNFEKKAETSKKLLTELGDMNYPTLFSFKGDTVFDDEYLKIFEKYAKQSNFAFQISIITADDDLARQVEIGVPSPTRRLEALKILSDMGYWTILRLRPFIIGITDPTLDELLERSLEAGISGISTEFFAMDSRTNEGMHHRYDWLAQFMGMGNIKSRSGRVLKDRAEILHEYFHKLSPSKRGGYMRLNRNVKELFIKRIYRFCAEHGLTLGVSDPDFKELCTSGSCCGMPDNFGRNPLLENWTRDQLTYHIKEARRIYHTTGKIVHLKFDTVFNEVSSPYLTERGFANEHIGVIGRNYAERCNLTQKLILQEQWNNLRSPSNPKNYFHDKLVPANYLDDQGNLVFLYNPMPYEQRWKDEGIDLTL